MKRLLAVLSLALVVSMAVGVGVANATHSRSDNPSEDFAVGGDELLTIPISPSPPLAILQEKTRADT